MKRMPNQTGLLAIVAIALSMTSPAWASDPTTKAAPVTTTPATKDAAATVPAAKNGTATASKKAKKARRDPGLNQPGAAGNAGPTPGVAGNAGPGH